MEISSEQIGHRGDDGDPNPGHYTIIPANGLVAR